MDGVSPLAIEGLMLELVAHLSRQFDIPLDAKRPRWLDQARDILEADCLSTINLTRLASEVGVHPVHMARVSKTLWMYAR